MNEPECGNLAGTVVDHQGTALPGAYITLTGQGTPQTTITNAPQTSVTNIDGAFCFNDINVGFYNVEARLDGFQTAVAPDVYVNASQTTQITLTV
jgi:carboxypeptidase family protein